MKDLRDSLRENAAYYRRQMKMIAARLAVLPKGTVKPKIIGRETFFYLQYRRGRTVKNDYIGKSVPPDLRAKLAERKRLEKELKQVREALKILRENVDRETDLVEPLRSILAGLTRENLWESGFEIIGSWCFLLYQRFLPVEKYPLKTQDLDILVALPYRGRAFDLADFFRSLGFSADFNADGSVFFTGPGIKVELLGSEKGNGRKPSKFIKEISATPQLLHYLDILFIEPVVLKVSPGVRAKVPSPASFTIHKLIIASLAKRAGKKEKDIRQAVYAGKYVLTEPSETKKLARLWDPLPKTWKTKARRALDDARDIVPLEQETVRRLQA